MYYFPFREKGIWKPEECEKKLGVESAKRKDASKILRGKKKLKTTDLSQKSFPSSIIVFINESPCSYYRFLWSECKKLWSKKSIISFWVSNGSIRIKESGNTSAILVSHINDLVKRFNIHVPARDENEEEF